SRTSVALAALMIAVAAAIGVGVMIASFREAVTAWLEGTLRADVYVSAPSLVGSRPDATLDPELVARLGVIPGVVRASTSRGVVVQSPRGPAQVVALAVDPSRPPRWRFRSGDDAGVWDGDAVIVSEPFANRHGVRVTVRLSTDHGERDFRVAGVFYDYGSSAFVGMLAALMSLSLERAREIGVLRALGLTPRQVWGLVTAQTGIIGLLAGVLAVPSGLLLAAVLVFVINRRSFGWTMSIDPSPSILLQGVALSLLAALLAGLYPAWRMATASPADSLRDE